MSGYTIAEFMDKCEWEGGVEEAIFGYGLDEKSLAVQAGPFYEAVKELAALGVQVRALTEKVYSLSEDEDE